MSIFNAITSKKPKKSVFDLSHDVKTTASMGLLYPILCEPVLPGDKWRVNTEIQCRLAPMLAPVMSRMDIYVHYFFVPNRLVWSDFQKFITGGENGTEEVPFPTFYLQDLYTLDLLKSGSLADHFGVQSKNYDSEVTFESNDLISALPFKGYQLIWNEYYRDQNLMDEVSIRPEENGIITGSSRIRQLNLMHLRAWQKDYFTSALPWSQRGPAVTLPLGSEAYVSGDADIMLSPETGTSNRFRKQGIYDPNEAAGRYNSDLTNSIRVNVYDQGGSSSDMPTMAALNEGSSYKEVNIDLNKTHIAHTDGLPVDLSSATAVTINELRKASRLQEWFEKNARGGARYIEQIFSHFGVRSSDSRLQRPEFLGGNKIPIMTTDVLQTSASQEDSAQANYAGIGGAMSKTRGFKRFFEEHGYIFGIMSIRPKPAYMQGIKKDLQKFDRFDFGWPEFSQLGEQPILNKEIYFDFGSSELNNKTFGYTPRYAEYKFINNSVHGDFRNSLNFWHLARIFGGSPNLTGSFVTVNELRDELSRIFAVETQLGESLDHFWLNIHHNIKAVRPLPKYGIPVL